MANVFTCERCGDNFARKDTLITHLKRKTSCPMTNSQRTREDIISELSHRHLNEKTFDCHFCGKKFNHSSCKCKHQHICRQNPVNNQTSNEVDVIASTHDTTSATTNTNDVIIEDNTKDDQNNRTSFDYLLTRRIEEAITPLIKEINVLKQNYAALASKLQKIQHQGQNISVVTDDNVVMDTRPPPHRKRKIQECLKNQVWDKWFGFDVGKAKCWCCNHMTIIQCSFVCGHVVAESQGGETTINNLRPICAPCNSSMGAENMKDFALRVYRREIL